MEIDFSDYVSESERHEIVVDEFRQAVARSLKTSNDVERFIGNVAYGAIGGVVDEVLGEEARAVIGEKAATIIRNLTPYTVFRTADTVLREKPSLAQRFLDEAVAENKDLIAKRVRRIINEVGQDEVRWALKEAIDNAFTIQKED